MATDLSMSPLEERTLSNSQLPKEGQGINHQGVHRGQQQAW